MAAEVVLQPNGFLGIWSTVSDGFMVQNMTADESVSWLCSNDYCKDLLSAAVKVTLAIAAGIEPYDHNLSYLFEAKEDEYSAVKRAGEAEMEFSGDPLGITIDLKIPSVFMVQRSWNGAVFDTVDAKTSEESAKHRGREIFAGRAIIALGWTLFDKEKGSIVPPGEPAVFLRCWDAFSLHPEALWVRVLEVKPTL